ncbi:MAG: pyridoxal-5-phosphate-dependent protein subunit beta, partial [Clostridiales bacterium]
FTSGSAGTTGAGDYLKERYPAAKLAVGEASQCPTLLNNGYGDHRIEGIGDKHVPWIHNVKNTDMIIDIDDNDSQNLLRLFNEPEGRQYLIEEAGVDPQLVEKLDYLGISGIANLLAAIKMAKYYELTEQDVIATVLTDSMEFYGSRLCELQEQGGAYNQAKAALDYGLHLMGQRTDKLLELTYPEKRRVHNLKYYTWIEQQGKELAELNAQWYDTDNYWGGVHQQAAQIDQLIDQFNQATGLLK